MDNIHITERVIKGAVLIFEVEGLVCNNIKLVGLKLEINYCLLFLRSVLTIDLWPSTLVRRGISSNTSSVTDSSVQSLPFHFTRFRHPPLYHSTMFRSLTGLFKLPPRNHALVKLLSCVFCSVLIRFKRMQNSIVFY